MGKGTIVGIIVVVVVIAAGVTALVVHGNSDKTGSSNTSSNTSMNNMNMNPQPAQSSSTPSATDSVTIENFAFSPASITVKKGTTVTWTNKDSTTHTVTSTSGPASFDSGDLATSKSFSFTFDAAGTYHYHCAIHSEMTGIVTVTE